MAQRGLLRAHGAEELVVLSADAVYKLDYRDVVEAHLEGGQQVTMVTTQVAPDDGGRYGVVQVGADDRITDYAYKPDEPATSTVAIEVFVMSARPVLERLETLAQEAGEDGLDDLGDHLLPDLVDDGLARAWALDGYWRDVGTVQAYWQAHRDFLAETPPLQVDDPTWPVHTREGGEGPAWVARNGEVDNSLLSGGARVAGSVAGSVLSPGVVVEAGPASSIRCRCRGCVCGRGRWCGARSSTTGSWSVPTRWSAACRRTRSRWSGRAAELSAGAVVPGGGRWPEDD